MISIMDDTLFSQLEPEKDEPAVYSVSSLTGEIKILLEETFPEIWVEGEISNFRISPSGHAYFKMKDEKATIDCVMWRSYIAGRQQMVQDGLLVRALGEISVYPPRGNYQFVVRLVRPAGKGALQERFEKLKGKLQEEGLFDEEHKKPIPELPKCIGVVTSPTGAAIQDFLRILRTRFPHFKVIVAPTRVQGVEAPGGIAQAIKDLNEQGEPDVIVVTRGGGSLEDLWAFNEEVVARAIFASKTPVVSAVGHEIDFTISDFVADLRVPTPTAAAEVFAQAGAEILKDVLLAGSRCIELTFNALEGWRQQIDTMKEALIRWSPISTVNLLRQRLDELMNHMGSLGLRRLESKQAGLHREYTKLKHEATAVLECRKQEFLIARETLKGLSPESILNRGYSITSSFETGSIVKDSSQVEAGELLQTRLHKGTIRSRVEGDNK